MSPERYKEIETALANAATAYRHAAEDEMGKRGSVHNVYSFMKEAFAVEGKARNLHRRYGVEPCNCGRY